MTYETIRFGAIDVKEEEILRFSEGLYGFEHEHEYSIIPFDPNIESPLEWMQSLKTPELAFIITDPFLYKPDYLLVLTDEEE